MEKGGTNAFSGFTHILEPYTGATRIRVHRMFLNQVLKVVSAFHR
jgi:hypothetical protein